ncbi:hypothetical protein D3C72_1425560 [compost metagenome]
MQRVALGDREARGRQALQPRREAGQARIAKVFGPAQVQAVEPHHHVQRQAVFARAVAHHRLAVQLGAVGAVVQQHAQRQGLARVAQHEAGTHRQVRARRVAADEELRGVDVERARVRREPAHHVDALVVRLRKLRLGRPRVVDADDGDARAARVLAHHAVVGVEAEQHEAAAVDVDQRALQAARLGVVHADAHVAVARGHLLFDRACHRRAAFGPRGAHLLGVGAAFGDRDGVALRVAAALGRHEAHELDDLRIERGRGGGVQPGGGQRSGGHANTFSGGQETESASDASGRGVAASSACV